MFWFLFSCTFYRCLLFLLLSRTWERKRMLFQTRTMNNILTCTHTSKQWQGRLGKVLVGDFLPVIVAQRLWIPWGNLGAGSSSPIWLQYGIPCVARMVNPAWRPLVGKGTVESICGWDCVIVSVITIGHSCQKRLLLAPAISYRFNKLIAICCSSSIY